MNKRLAVLPVIIGLLLVFLSACGTELSPPAAKERPSAPYENKKTIDPPEIEKAFSDAEPKFAFDLLERLIKEESALKHNINFSPYSIQQVLAMTANGAGGSSQQEILDAIILERCRIVEDE
jgi:serpin B